jgi:hypothetical protein
MIAYVVALAAQIGLVAVPLDRAPRGTNPCLGGSGILICAVDEAGDLAMCDAWCADE